MNLSTDLWTIVQTPGKRCSAFYCCVVKQPSPEEKIYKTKSPGIFKHLRTKIYKTVSFHVLC